MDKDTIKRLFENNVNTDADYFIILFREPILPKEVGPWTWNTVPRKEPSEEGYPTCWKTLDEAIPIIFATTNWNVVEVYDLYSPFENALIATIKKEY